ncbi:hypothetical protein L7F22_047905 [Adiantum nelumboides]|nr:hypothetical protein [Adiantum nelumboides]MCO5593886.1 hypothetical protein [Adiantum nelumboides]
MGDKSDLLVINTLVMAAWLHLYTMAHVDPATTITCLKDIQRNLSARAKNNAKEVYMGEVWALNEVVEGSAKNVFRSWDLRLDTSNRILFIDVYVASDDVLQGYLESNDGDPELLLFIPFTTDVKIKSISIIGAGDGRSPSRMRAFLNREDVDFSTAAAMNPIQEWELGENLQGTLEYQTRYAKFQSVASLILHFPENFGAGTTGISFIGLQGEATQLKRDAVANIVYEALPNPAEHRVPAENNVPTVL